MSAFDSRTDDGSSESMDRSRSTPERGTVDAASLRIIAQGTPVSDSTSSEGRRPNVQGTSLLVPTNQAVQSPDGILSQFIRGDSHEQSPISLPTNPFQPPRNPAEGSPGFGQGSGACNSQSATFIRNELNLSVDPFILAEANQAVDRSRQEAMQFAGDVVNQVRNEAGNLIEQERNLVRNEASQFASQVQHEAQRVVGETQSKAAFAKKLKKRQDLSRVLLSHFFEVAEVVLSQGGHIAFEWPKGAKGWLLPELVAFMKRHKLFMAGCHGCFFGMKSSKGKPMFKPWHIATSSYRLAANLDTCRCQHEKDSNMTMRKAVKLQKPLFTQEQCLGPSVSVFIQKQSFPCQ